MEARTIITLIDGSDIIVTQEFASVYSKLHNKFITLSEVCMIEKTRYNGNDGNSVTEREYTNEPIVINTRNILTVRKHK